MHARWEFATLVATPHIFMFPGGNGAAALNQQT
jgi:hypothetical protein